MANNLDGTSIEEMATLFPCISIYSGRV